MFIIARLILDAAGIVLCYSFAYLLSFKILSITNIIAFPFSQYHKYFIVITVIYLSSFYLVGMYKQRKGFLIEVDEVLGSITSVTLAWSFLIVLTYLKGEYSYSRSIILLSWPISIVFITICRLTILRLEMFARSRGWGGKRAAIIGQGELAKSVAEKIKENPSYGIQFIRYINNNNISPANLSMIVNDNKIQMLFVADPALDREKLTELAAFCDNAGIELGTIPDVFQILTTSPTVENIAGIPTITLKQTSFTTLNRLLKRAFDISLALFGLIIFSIPIFMIILLIKIFSPGGTAIYSQERVGRGEKIFNLLKFRTMIPDAEAKTGPILATGDDPRKTPIGRILRTTNLDELPQLINILRGDMSFVGPRPERPVFVEEFKQLIPKYMERHRIRPGLAGWAQLHGGYHMPAGEKIKYDLYYIENWSFLLDIKIILKYIQIAFTLQRRN
jgi:exopolysaccharide biosynthesis polyprenyl glycosylphosphotransferase